MVTSHTLVLYSLECTTNIIMDAFDVGMKFDDFKKMGGQVEQFEKENFVKLSKSDYRKMKAAATRYPRRKCKEQLVYAELKVCCHHGGKN